jgi:hypothetical protein
VQFTGELDARQPAASAHAPKQFRFEAGDDLVFGFDRTTPHGHSGKG